jgi:hypothetical protein
MEEIKDLQLLGTSQSERSNYMVKGEWLIEVIPSGVRRGRGGEYRVSPKVCTPLLPVLMNSVYIVHFPPTTYPTHQKTLQKW